MKNVLSGFAVVAAIVLSTLVSNVPARAITAVPPPTGVTATWAGYNVSGQVTGVSLTWNTDSAATSYNVYRGTAVVPQPLGNSTLIATGLTGTRFYDPGITIGVDTVTFYQVTAVNSLGESAKTAPVVAAQLPAVQSTIQGVILPTPGPIPGYITVQVNPFSCPSGQICPDFIPAPQIFLVDIRGVIYEAANGTPVAPFPLLAQSSVVVTGNREPGAGTPVIQASTIEHDAP